MRYFLFTDTVSKRYFYSQKLYLSGVFYLQILYLWGAFYSQKLYLLGFSLSHRYCICEVLFVHRYCICEVLFICRYCIFDKPLPKHNANCNNLKTSMDCCEILMPVYECKLYYCWLFLDNSDQQFSSVLNFKSPARNNFLNWIFFQFVWI